MKKVFHKINFVYIQNNIQNKLDEILYMAHIAVTFISAVGPFIWTKLKLLW